MARIDTLADFLEDIANKIRSKTGSQSTITPANYDTEIEKIVFKPNKKISFSENTAEFKTTTLNLKNLDTSDIDDMTNLFLYLTKLETLDLSHFNTSKVEKMTAMFRFCSSLTILNLNTFDTNNVVNMQNMFYSCAALETITFGENFTFKNITNLNNMFNNCTKLDNNTLNSILYLCTTATSYTGTKTLATLGIKNTFDNYANIPNLSNYQAFLNAGWTIS